MPARVMPGRSEPRKDDKDVAIHEPSQRLGIGYKKPCAVDGLPVSPDNIGITTSGTEFLQRTILLTTRS